MKDFRAFAESDAADSSPPRPASASGPSSPRSTLVLVDRLDVVSAGDLVLVGMEGSHFLWKMVRRVVGVLVEIGRGGLEPSAASTFLTESSDGPARLTAPASGLFLERVWYPGEPRDHAIGAATPMGHAGSSRMPSTRRTTSA